MCIGSPSAGRAASGKPLTKSGTPSSVAGTPDTTQPEQAGSDAPAAAARIRSRAVAAFCHSNRWLRVAGIQNTIKQTRGAIARPPREPRLLALVASSRRPPRQREVEVARAQQVRVDVEVREDRGDRAEHMPVAAAARAVAGSRHPPRPAPNASSNTTNAADRMPSAGCPSVSSARNGTTSVANGRTSSSFAA